MLSIGIYLQILFPALLSAIILNFLIPFLKKYVVDKPNKRSSHITSKPTAGGISFVIVGTLFLAFNGNFYPLMCIPLAVVGFLDDFLNLSRKSRLFIQTLTVILLLSGSISDNYLFTNSSELLKLVFIIFLLCFFLGVINFINFMDGLDGLVAGSMSIVILTGSILISDTYWPLFGALLGFIFFNWYPSKIFMGDCGSTYLGGVFIGIILLSSNWINALKIVLVATPLITDALFCIVRRFLHKELIFEAHRSHLYQRLHQSGWSHGSVAILYLIFTSILAASVIFFDIKLTLLFIFLELLVAIWLDQKVSVPFLSSISTEKIL